MPPAVVKELHGLVSPVWQFPPTVASSPPPSGALASAPFVLPTPALALALAPLGPALPVPALVLASLVTLVPPSFVLPLLLATPLDPALPPDTAGPWLPLPEEATPFPGPPLPDEELLQPAWISTTARLVARSANTDLEVLEQVIGPSRGGPHDRFERRFKSFQGSYKSATEGD